MSKRPAMLASVIRDIISPVLRECPKECGMVSVSRIEVSKDFSYATAYISALSEVEIALKFLESRIPALQTALGSVYRKRIPSLRFRIDFSVLEGERIDTLLNENDS